MRSRVTCKRSRWRERESKGKGIEVKLFAREGEKVEEMKEVTLPGRGEAPVLLSSTVKSDS